VIKNMATIFLVSGGTGGHIFPAEALAGVLLERGHNPVLITDDRFGKFKTKMLGVEIHVVKSGAMGGGIFGRIKGVINIIRGFLQTRKLLNEMQPSAIVGFGGYPSFPPMLAAVYSKYKDKTMIHEQNSILGKTNFVLASRVKIIATSFNEVKGINDGLFERVRLTGNPVRAAIKSLSRAPFPEIHEEGLLKILVIGGSQGASIFSEVLPKAVALLTSEFRRRLRIDQQCREKDIEETKEKYSKLGISADLSTFFTDVPARLATSHLVITRSGASTLAELTISGRPAILVPYPHATDDHQRINAQALEEIGAGWVMPDAALTPEALAEKLEAFLKMPSLLTEAAEKCRTLGSPDADQKLADLVEGLIGVTAEEDQG
jgi:UDP-N-acetylglucosamine--N-acetylmuramyl-(pentapeptide) pyrophosphoryl-undecaprenol N-acetylglucosamine transferase